MTFEEQLEIEDYLQDHGVFVNGISGKQAHSDSYMTVVDFKQLDKALSGDYDWQTFAAMVADQPNTSIPMAIVCAFIKGRAGQ